MRSHRFWIAAWCGLAAVGPARAGTPAEDATGRDVQVLAAKIDALVGARLETAKAVPAPQADDAEYLRRVYLDVAGRIPSVAEARAFLKDADPYKRQKVVERLLNGPGYVNHFSNVWRGLLLPESVTDFNLQYYILPSFEAWVRKQFAENVPYDKMVRDLLTAPAGIDQQRLFGNGGPSYDPTPSAYYLAKEAKPENLGASTARLFLGVRIECAQCHNHPFARWTREQFWEYAAFFAGLDRPFGNNFFNPVREINDRRELPISGTGNVVQATFLDGTEPRWKYKVSARVTLAEWMTSPENRYFSRAAANRMWAYFMGLGIVEPVDDMSDDHPPSHPELLDELARQFAAHKFDFKFLIRAITASQAYQRTSTQTHPSQKEPRLFARMPVRGLSPEQLFESIAQATGFRQEPRDRNPFVFGNTTVRQDFIAKFGSQDKRTETQTTILQALALMNGSFVNDATSLERSATLAAVAEAPFLDDAGRIEALYLAALARKPRPEELSRMLKYVRSGGAKKRPKVALGDCFWALLNSSEFMLNH